MAHYSFIKESFMERSDNYYVFVCKFCGLLSESNTKMNYFKCSNKKCNHYTS